MKNKSRREFIRHILRWSAGGLLALTTWAALRGNQTCSESCANCQRADCKKRTK